MRCSRNGNGGRIQVILNGESLEEVGCLKFVGSQGAADGGCERDLVNKNEGYRLRHYRAYIALKSVQSNRGLGINAKKCLYEEVFIPMALYGAESWGLRNAERRKFVNIPETKCLRRLGGVSRMDRVRMKRCV